MKAQALAVVFGAAAGVGLALVRRADEVPPLAPAAARPLATMPAAAAPLASAPAAAAALPDASATVSPPSSSSGAPASSAGGLVLKPPAPLPPITTPDELTAAEIKCYQKDPEACRRAADAYEAGRMVPRDAERARNYRKVELTQLVRGCERDSPNSCLVLAERYQSGDGVARSTRQAAALVDRARTLCRRNVNPTECAALKLTP
jgi:TPR repeat protein